MQKQYKDAIVAYNSDIKEFGNDADLIVNAIVFFWDLYDGGTAFAAGLNMKEQEECYARALYLMNYGKVNFCGFTPLIFWTEYILGYESGDFITSERCLELKAQSPEYFEPEFVLLTRDARRYGMYKLKVDSHIEYCSANPTARNRYCGAHMQDARRQYIDTDTSRSSDNK